MHTPVDLKQNLIAYARSLGFERVGVTSAKPLPRDETYLQQWLAEGCAGEMDYMVKEPQRRARPTNLLPGAKSVIALAMNYYQASPPPHDDLGLARIGEESVVAGLPSP